jgi:hypothetical protein
VAAGGESTLRTMRQIGTRRALPSKARTGDVAVDKDEWSDIAAGAKGRDRHPDQRRPTTASLQTGDLA